MKYRAEIDGLRALAVVPVILFHAGFEMFSGGFVGVDVFFVISGYLITTILIEDIENNRFSILNFYERRARRILPALFFVMLICFPFSWMWMLPSQMKDFSHSVIAVSLFVSNIFFWQESDYFAAAEGETPLLHTWSLAVEEQYYVLFPIFLFLAWRFGKNKVFWMIVVFSAISLALSEWGWRNKAAANFFLAPTRAWELFAGSIVAFIVQKRGVQSNNLLSLLGLAAILIAIFVYDELTPFPSVYALVPVVGVMLLVLFADKDTLVAKLLSTKVFVGIGLVSYSAYLWHQPLFAFARIRSLEEPPLYLIVLLSVLSVALAVGSWWYVEKPFRSQSISRMSTKHVFGSAVLGLFAFTAVGIFGHLNNGYSERINGWNVVTQIPDIASSYCHNSGRRTVTQLLDDNFCLVGEGPVKLAIFGDSHGGALFEYADEHLSHNNVAALAVSGGFCAPLLNGFEAGDNCIDTTALTFERILNDSEIRKVILVAEWAIYTQGFRGNDSPRLWKDNEGRAGIPTDNADIFARSFEETIERLLDAEKEVLVVHPVPEFHQYAYQWLGKQVLFGGYTNISSAIPTLPSITEAEYHQRNAEVFRVFDAYHERISFLPVFDLFCKNNECRQYDETMNVLYSDYNHVNYFGAKLIIDKLTSNFLIE